MRLLALLLCSMCFSSCFAIGLGALITTVVATGNRTEAKEGAVREARLRALSEQEAAVIRKRYNEMEARSQPPPPGAALQPQPTPPPLVIDEPVRKPLRAREPGGR